MLPVRVYVTLNLLGALSYILLEKAIIRSNNNEALKRAVKESKKELWTIVTMLLALVLSFFPGFHYLSCQLLLIAMAPWIIPDLRMKRVFKEAKKSK